MTAEGEPNIARPTEPDKTTSKLIREGLITNPDGICFIDPQIAGKLLAEHFEHLTLDQFEENNKRAPNNV